MKSNLEKEAILNSYKLFLKSCDFNIQILIQSKKEDLSNYFIYLKKISENESNEKIKNSILSYINLIRRKVEENKSSSKNFYIIVKYDIETNEKQIKEEIENLAITYLSDCLFKIKECIDILTSFFIQNNDVKIEKEEII